MQRFNIPGFGPPTNNEIINLQASLQPRPTATGWRVPAVCPPAEDGEAGVESSSEEGGPSKDRAPASDHGSSTALAKSTKLPPAKESWLVSIDSVLLLTHVQSVLRESAQSVACDSRIISVQ